MKNLAYYLRSAWSYKTSSVPEFWDFDNTALGQCVPTSLIVQDYFGGVIVRTVALLPDGTSDSHYFNELEIGELDLTRQQFPYGTIFSERSTERNGKNIREYLLESEDVKRRYNSLKRSLERVSN